MQFFCSECGVQNLVHILYKNTKFQTFSIDVQSSDPVQVKDPSEDCRDPLDLNSILMNDPK